MRLAITVLALYFAFTYAINRQDLQNWYAQVSDQGTAIPAAIRRADGQLRAIVHIGHK